MTAQREIVGETQPYATYQSMLSAGQIAFQRCLDCATSVFYPRTLCPHCGSEALVWESSGGRGVVYSTTEVPLGDGSSYSVCLVDLEEGFRMMSTVIDIPPSQLSIGQRVLGRVEHRPGVDGQADQARVVFCREDVDGER